MDEETVFNGWVIFNLLDDIDIGPKPDPVDFYYVIISKKKKRLKWNYERTHILNHNFPLSAVLKVQITTYMKTSAGLMLVN